MKTAFALGRICWQRRPPAVSRAFARRPPCFWQSPNKTSLLRPGRRRARRLPGTPRTILAIAALSPAAFIHISEDEVTDGQTAEAHMLEASRQETTRKIPSDVYGLNRLFRCTVSFVDQYIYEPVATSLRFLHLVIIFVPVVVTIPAIW